MKVGEGKLGGARSEAPRVTKAVVGATGGKRRMRNYRAMREQKLRACLQSLTARAGEAYERCLNTGSGDPDADLVEIQRIANEKGWQ